MAHSLGGESLYTPQGEVYLTPNVSVATRILEGAEAPMRWSDEREAIEAA